MGPTASSRVSTARLLAACENLIEITQILSTKLVIATHAVLPAVASAVAATH